jgi:phosphohistidine swiveling domain-containing protein
MTEWYKATTIKEIFWKGQVYRSGEKIKIIKEDVAVLSDAGVIGLIEKIVPEVSIESAVQSIPENQAVKKRRGRKPIN